MYESNQAEAVIIEDSPVIRKKIIRIVSVVVIVLVLFFGGLKLSSVLNPFTALSGKIFLTLVPYPTIQTDASDLYTYDIESQKFEKIFETDLLKYTGQESPDGKKFAYFAKPKKDVLDIFQISKDPLALFVYDKESDSHSQLTENYLYANKLGGWSPDNTRVVFTGQPKNYETWDEFLKPNSWSVDIIGVDKQLVHIDEGTNPIWTPDGKKIIYLKDDGLYVHNIAAATSEKFYDLSQYHEAKINIIFTISPNGKYLFLTSPDDHNAFLFSINNLDSLALTILDQIPTENSFTSLPYFSPDGRFVVYHQVDYYYQDDEIAYRNPRLMVYDTKTAKKMKLVDLDQYNFDFTHIDGWK